MVLKPISSTPLSVGSESSSEEKGVLPARPSCGTAVGAAFDSDIFGGRSGVIFVDPLNVLLASDNRSRLYFEQGEANAQSLRPEGRLLQMENKKC